MVVSLILLITSLLHVLYRCKCVMSDLPEAREGIEKRGVN
jgi:hypothetical protein